MIEIKEACEYWLRMPGYVFIADKLVACSRMRIPNPQFKPIIQPLCFATYADALGYCQTGALSDRIAIEWRRLEGEAGAFTLSDPVRRR